MRMSQIFPVVNQTAAICFSLLAAAFLFPGMADLNAAPEAPAASARPTNRLDASGAADTGAVLLGKFTQPETRRWRSIPHGTQSCDGILFVCEGALRTAGFRAAREGNHYPGAILGIPVNRRGSRIHLLQAAENSLEMVEGVPYGRMVLHFENGESRKLDLQFGIHGADWLAREGEPAEQVADPNSRVAWTQRRAGDNSTIHLYHTVFENPLPDKMISSADCLSPMSEANLLLFGIAVSDEPRSLAHSYGPGETLADTAEEVLTFQLRNTGGQAVTEGSLSWSVEGPRGRIDFPPFHPDARGQISFEFARGAARRIQYQASEPSGAAASGELRPGDKGRFPKTTIVTLTPRSP